MRPVLLSRGSLGNSPWCMDNYLQRSYKIGMGAMITSGAVLTFGVQHSFDDPVSNRRPVSISRTTTVATVTDVDHRLSVGDSVIVDGSGDPNLDGTYDVASVVDANTYTYTVANTGAAAGSVNTYLASLRVFNHSTMTGLSARTDGNYEFPVRAIRLRVSAYTSGKVDLEILQGLGS